MTKRLLLCAALLALALPAAAAAEPAHTATMDAAATEFKWSGGPLVGFAATTEIDGQYPCGSPGHMCDDALLSLPAGGDLAVKMAGTNEAAVDLDLYLFQSDATGEPGKLLRESVSFGSAESVAAPKLKPGFYLVRVNTSVSPGGTYDAVATLKNAGAAAVAGPPVTGTPTANAAPTATIAKLAKSVKAKSLKGFSGTAGDDKGVAKVELALHQVKGSSCSAMSAKGSFKKAACDAGTYLAAKGTGKWSYKLRKALKRGSYQLAVRVTDGDGVTSVVKQAFKVR
jgi:hypothetical protein